MVERAGVCVPVASPQRERKQCCCFSGRGRRESTDVLKGGSLPRLADHAKVLTLHPPPGRCPYPEGRHKAP